MSEYVTSIHGSGWAVVVFTLLAGVISAIATILSSRAAEKGARERASAAAEREQRQHAWAVLQAGYTALQRGDPLDLMIHEEFWELAEKEEARRRAMGSTRESVFVRFPAAAGRGVPVVEDDEEAEEQRDPGTERGSFQQAPASHRASSPDASQDRQSSPLQRLSMAGPHPARRLTAGRVRQSCCIARSSDGLTMAHSSPNRWCGVEFAEERALQEKPAA